MQASARQTRRHRPQSARYMTVPVSKVGDIITIRVTGNGFLYNMVRIIAGTLVKIGGSDMPADAMNGIIATTDRAADHPGPAHGLTMIGLKYE